MATLGNEPGLAELPLPEESSYYLAIQMINSDISRQGYKDAIRTQLSDYSHGHIGSHRRAALFIANKFLRPVDRSTGPDLESKIPDIFSDGAVAGAAIARYAHYEKVPFLHLLGGEHSLRSDDETDDVQQLDFGFSKDLVGRSDEGLGLIGAQALEMVEGWADDQVIHRYGPEHLRDSHMFLRGCGYVVLRARNFHQALVNARLAELEAQLLSIEGVSAQGGFDWDKDWQAFNNPGENS